jgi:hypothetical protein
MNAKRNIKKTKESPSKKVEISHSKMRYGFMVKGKVMGGISNPYLYDIKDARESLLTYPKNTKIVGIRVTYEVVSEVIP